MNLNAKSSANSRFPVGIDELESQFSDWEMTKANAYYQDGRVLQVNSPSLNMLTAKVQGTRNTPYSVRIHYLFSQKRIVGSCSCPVGHNCKHVIAAILEFMFMREVDDPYEAAFGFLNETSSFSNNPGVADKNTPWQNWFGRFNRENESLGQNENSTADKKYAILYVIKLQEYGISKEVAVDVVVSRRLKNGGYGVDKPYRYGASHNKYAEEIDRFIYDRLRIIDDQSDFDYGYISDDTITLHDHHFTANTIKDIVDTGRCFFW